MNIREDSADPNKQNDAEQALADKQNDLYNYALEIYNTNVGKCNKVRKFTYTNF